MSKSVKFQSTRLLRGATGVTDGNAAGLIFQSTRLLRGATFKAQAKTHIPSFQSTRLLRGATDAGVCNRAERRISIHAPLARRDRR